MKTLIASILAFSACVTVNVNFPESAVQKATDDYVKDLYRAKEKNKAPVTSTESKPSTFLYSIFGIQSAYAEDNFVFQIDSSATKAIQQRQLGRIDEVVMHKKAGVLGETIDGHVMIKDSSKVKPLLAKKLDALVKEENSDRDALYQEVIKLNKMPGSRLKNIQNSFSKSFQNESPAGTWIQTESGWSQK